MLALTASTPIHGGYLTNVDCRWSVIEQAVDDRNSESKIKKSRYSSIATFLTRNETKRALSHGQKSNLDDDDDDDDGDGERFETKIKARSELDSLRNTGAEEAEEELYPNEWKIDKSLYKRLISRISDPRLVSHFSYILSVDPIITQDVPDITDHFCYDNIQSTNWQSLRLKIPSPTHHSLGWRVEFRTMEVQPSDFENAAFCVFVYILARAFDLMDENSEFTDDFQTPSRRDFFNYHLDCNGDRNPKHIQKYRQSKQSGKIVGEDFNFGSIGNQQEQKLRKEAAQIFTFNRSIDEIDENMARAQRMDAIKTQLFLFNGKALSCNLIVNGQGGLLEIIYDYIESHPHLFSSWQSKDRNLLNSYLEFVSKRASGTIPTVSSRIRSFVQTHPSYRRDSVITPQICTDLVDYWRDWSPLNHESAS